MNECKRGRVPCMQYILHAIVCEWGEGGGRKRDLVYQASFFVARNILLFNNIVFMSHNSHQ